VKLALHNYWRSSASHRVRIALGLKQLAYDYVAVNIMKDAHRADDYRAKNPSAQVPTLEITEDDGTVHALVQSLPIMEYLEERFPQPPILPRDPVLRARARALAEIVNSGIQPLQNLSTTNAVKQFGGDAGAWPKEFIARGLAAYARLVLDTAQRLGSAPVYSVGETPTIADCCLVPQLASARRFGVDYRSHQVLVDIEERCMSLPAFQRAAPDEQPDAVRS
jgi:maleylpyruvate isomerase